MMVTHEVKLDGPGDWERWRKQFQSLAWATDLWEVIQGEQRPLKRPVKPEYRSYQRATVNLPPLQTRSQSSSTADNSQSTVQQEEIPVISTNYSHLSAADQRAYSAAYSIFENEMKLYKSQQRRMQKLIDYIHQMITSIYIKNCCDPEYSLDTWYANLKKMAVTFTTQEFINAREQYMKAIQSLTKIKDYNK